ncbi:hypothetical protein L9F63_008545, partial [Diploptera punctata]
FYFNKLKLFFVLCLILSLFILFLVEKIPGQGFKLKIIQMEIKMILHKICQKITIYYFLFIQNISAGGRITKLCLLLHIAVSHVLFLHKHDYRMLVKLHPNFRPVTFVHVWLRRILERLNSPISKCLCVVKYPIKVEAFPIIRTLRSLCTSDFQNKLFIFGVAFFHRLECLNCI